MEEKIINSSQQPDVPYTVYESGMARMERVNKRCFLAWLITFLLLVGCVTGFIWYEAQFTDEITETYESEASGGGLAIVNRDGSVNTYGAGEIYQNDEENP